MTTFRGLKLKEAREQAGFTQPQLADAVGTRWEQISRAENGHMVLRAETLAKIAAYLDVPMEAFFEANGGEA